MSESQSSGGLKVYVASRVKHAPLWRNFRDVAGVQIISTWIDEAGEGETADMSELWERILREVWLCDAVVFYVGVGDVPLKGAYVEAGMALALGKPVFAVIDEPLEPRSLRPVGSWLHHPNVEICPTLKIAMALASSAGRVDSNTELAS